MPTVIQTPGTEFEPCRRAARLYRLDQPGNPHGDPAKKSALSDRQFIQVPNECQLPVHIYSMPKLEFTGKRIRDSACHRLRAHLGSTHPAPRVRTLIADADDLRDGYRVQQFPASGVRVVDPGGNRMRIEQPVRQRFCNRQGLLFRAGPARRPARSDLPAPPACACACCESPSSERWLAQ